MPIPVPDEAHEEGLFFGFDTLGPRLVVWGAALFKALLEMLSPLQDGRLE